MTWQDVLAEIKLLNPNDVPDGQERKWLYQLEQQLCDEVLTTHELTPEEERQMAMIQAGEYTGSDYRPIAQPPYNDVYVHYVGAQIALANVDTEQYSNEQTMYNNALITYKNHFNRTHRGKMGGEKWRF